MNTRLIIHDKIDPAMNMAIDESLLSVFVPGDPVILRFYDWDYPATTIGRLQSSNNYSKTNQPVLRRPTGGGTVLHGSDITFSLVFSLKDIPLATSYKKIHTALQKGLLLLGINSFFSHERTDKDYLVSNCFALPVTHDLMCEGKKIAGGAQKRKKDTVLHQGSIQNIPNDFSRKIIIQSICSGFETVFAMKSAASDIMKEEQVLSKKLYQEKYSRNSWNYRR